MSRNVEMARAEERRILKTSLYKQKSVFQWVAAAAVVIASSFTLVACGNSGTSGSNPSTVNTLGYGVYGTASGLYAGNLAVTNKSAFSTLMQYAGQCNPYWIGINIGSANCNSWTSSGYLTLTLNSSSVSQVSMSLVAGANINLWGGGIAPTAQGIALTSIAVAAPYNNNNGLQIIGTNSYGNGSGIRLMIPNGSLSSSSMTGSLYFQDQSTPFANVTLTRVY